jgi:prepilin-type N-terminal cleavage/methylation domain-containing protein
MPTDPVVLLLEHKSMFNIHNLRTRTGFTLIEIILGIALICLIAYGITSFFTRALQTGRISTDRITAALLAEEGIEVLKAKRNQNWSNIGSLSTTTTYSFSWTGFDWATTTTVQSVEGYYWRSFVVTDVFRDNNDDIVTTGGTYTTSTKKITMSVAWQSRFGWSTSTIETYLTNLFQ